ncbi:MAG: VOC family protein [Candidatus Acidiferrales bacterium]
MAGTQPRFIGVELYFDNLSAATNFYSKTLGLAVADEEAGHYAKFSSGAGFVCLEKKGVESYPSRDKAVLFFEVPDLQAAIAAIGKDRIVQAESAWAVLHDPEGHNILLLEKSRRAAR